MQSLHESVVTDLLSMRRDEWLEVALEANVPLATLQKVAYRHTPNPRIHTVEALARAIAERKANVTSLTKYPQ